VASLIAESDGSYHGKISVNLDGETGTGSFQLQGGQPNSIYNLSFCLYPTDSGPRGNGNCIFAGPDFNTDANGNATMPFHFAKSGIWNGIFVLGGQFSVDSGFEMPANGLEFQSPFFRCLDISSQFQNGFGTCGSDPLISGFVTVSGTTVHLSLTGAAASVTYSAFYCGNSKGPCKSVGNVATDTNGNGAADVDYLNTVGSTHYPGIFYFSRDEGGGNVRSEFGSAFKVP
jgi:hypothetical protein